MVEGILGVALDALRNFLEREHLLKCVAATHTDLSLLMMSRISRLP